MMEKQKTKREQGIEAWKEWRMGNLRGHHNIGQQIMKDYGVTQADIDNIRRESWNRYERLRRKRIKLIKSKGGIENETKNKESFKEETIKENSQNS